MKSLIHNYKMNFNYKVIFELITSNITLFFVWLFTVYLLPTYEFCATLVFLVMIDLVLGIWKSKKQLIPITSKEINRSIEKAFIYMLGTIVSYVIQHHITKDLVPVMYLWAALISLREFKSIVENIEIITNIQVWKQLIALIQDKIIPKIPAEKSENTEEKTNET